MWNKVKNNLDDTMKNNSNRVGTPSKFFVVNDLKGLNPNNNNEGSLMRSSDSKIKNQIRLAMEVRNGVEEHLAVFSI